MPIAEKIAGHISGSSWIRKMFEEGERLRKEFGDDNVYDFTLGNPDAEPPETFRSELRRLAESRLPGMHRYMSNAGYMETRAAVAAKITRSSGVKAGPEHVIMTCGAGGALNVALKTILDPGDEVIILAPFFVEYKFYIDNHGGTPVVVMTDMESFQLDMEAIEKAITSKTRGILICSPNNPTGVIYPEESLMQLNELIKKTGRKNGRMVYLISDEPYSGILYDGKHLPSVFSLVENSVIATSHSKDLALPGERIGYLAANPRMGSVMQFIEGAIFSNRVLGFVNAPALMQRLVAKLQDESVNIAEYQKKRDMLVNELTSIGFSMVKPDGAFYLFPKSPIQDDIRFVEEAQKEHILLVPGRGFGAPGFFRIAYCTGIDLIERSLPAWHRLASRFF